MGEWVAWHVRQALGQGMGARSVAQLLRLPTGVTTWQYRPVPHRWLG
jgi:hypothetical protein